MKTDVRILVASDISADAEVVLNLLLQEFTDVTISTDGNRATQDFEERRPQVLVLAFNNLTKAERYYHTLYRTSTIIHSLRPRAIVLCNKDELQLVYALCRKEWFDDYVLFWPIGHDAPRLRMAVHHAARMLRDEPAGSPSAAELAAQARRIAELEVMLERSLRRGGERIDVLSRSLTRAERDVGNAIDDFSRRLIEPATSPIVDLRDSNALLEAFNQLKNDEISKHFDRAAASVKPLREWVESMGHDLAPQLAGARMLQMLAAKVKPLVLVVDDDEFQHRLLAQLLIEEQLELAFATSASTALAAMRKRAPELILMDVQLPDMSGIEVTQRLKSVQQFASIPVVMITGASAKSTVIDSLKAGAADFVVKPFDKEKLVAKMRHFLVPEHAAPGS